MTWGFRMGLGSLAPNARLGACTVPHLPDIATCPPLRSPPPSQGALILKILRGKFPPVTGYSPDISDLIKRCLTQVRGDTGCDGGSHR